eukprot:scaffold11551_cov112-Isochrysis_galbana.AAC.2
MDEPPRDVGRVEAEGEGASQGGTKLQRLLVERGWVRVVVHRKGDSLLHWVTAPTSHLHALAHLIRRDGSGHRLPQHNQQLGLRQRGAGSESDAAGEETPASGRT